MSEKVLETQGLVGYLEGASGIRAVLRGVDVTVCRGRAVGLLGESGCGKTFLLHSLLGLHEGVPGLVAGRARVMGIDVFEGLWRRVILDLEPSLRIRKDVSRWTREVRRRLRPVVGSAVTLVPQDPLTSLSPFHTVGQLLDRAVRRGGRPSSPAEVEGWLERVHIYGASEVAGLYPRELSGGMAQRVAVALALAPGPQLLAADEPTTGLDATLRVRVLDLLAEAADAYGVTLFLITHDVEAARLLVRDVAVLNAGRIVEEGPVERVLDRRVEPKHPYTRFLLAMEARFSGAPEPGPDGRSQAVPALPGGCPYAPACPAAGARCAGPEPELVEVARGHRVACHREAPR